MTVYYIDPGQGDDSRTGLSWGTAWKTLRGLRLASIVPVAGDEFRFAKSEEDVSGSIVYEYWGGQTAVEYRLRGAYIFSTTSPAGSNHMQIWNPSGSGSLQVRALTFIDGAATIDTPTYALDYYSGYYSVHAVGVSGQFNTPDTVMFGFSLGGLSASGANGLYRFRGAIRCHVPYVGPGEDDLPEGALSISFYAGTTLLASCPLPPIRNSDVVWTPFSVEFAPWPSVYRPDITAYVNRTALTLARDNTAFGIELSDMVFDRLGTPGALDTLFSCDRGSYGGGNSPENVGDNFTIYAESLVSAEFGDTSEAVSVGYFDNVRAEGENIAIRRAYFAEDIHMAGRSALSPAGAKGVYDLNGSLGGTAGAPILLTGGWNPSLDAVDGVTAFSGGLSPKFSANSTALFDLGNADHIKLKNIAACYGFASLISRARTVEIDSGMLPWSVAPAFGQATTDTHVTLKNMYIAPPVLEGFGTIGDLTLENVYYISFGNPYAYRRNEVRNLTMTNAGFNGQGRALFVRGDGLLTQCSLSKPPQLVSIEFGHTLTFIDHKPFNTQYAAKFIPTSPESRWDHIIYADPSMPTYSFVQHLPMAASADAKVTAPGGIVQSPALYPTALRGSSMNQTYMDGLNDFNSTSAFGASEGSERGWMYSHFMGQRPSPYSSLENPDDIAVYGDMATPPWVKQYSDDTGTVVTEDAQFTATGRVFLMRKSPNITYRSDAELYVVSARKSQYGYSRGVWATLKAVYVPKAGTYRAHFGYMKENLAFSTLTSGDVLRIPLTMYVTGSPVSSGLPAGKFGVVCNTLVGPAKEVTYYFSTAEEAAAGGGNAALDEWHDFYIDFETYAAGLVELRHGSLQGQPFTFTIFDDLEVYERS